MGRVRRSRTHSNQAKNAGKGQKTRRYTRDMDQIHEDLKDNGLSKKQWDLARKEREKIPGMGEFYCVVCARYMASQAALETHVKSKIHKQRNKKAHETPYTIEESRAAAGVGIDNGK